MVDGARRQGARRTATRLTTAGRNFGSLPACFLLQRAPMKMSKENRSGGLSTGETPLVAGRGRVASQTIRPRAIWCRQTAIPGDH